MDAGRDVGPEAAPDAAPDAGPDAGLDLGAAPDAGEVVGVDAGGDPWASVAMIADAHEIPNLALIVGDASGRLFVHEKGNATIDTNYGIASASKWMTAAVIAALIDEGALSLDDHPQDYLSYWTSDPEDPRSGVTLEQLLAFTSGIGGARSDIPCLTDTMMTLQGCAQVIYNEHFEHDPETAFHYSPGHMHIAAAMAEVATGSSWVELLDTRLKAPLSLTWRTRFQASAQENPGVAGAMLSTAAEYATFLESFYTGAYLPNWTEALLQIRTRGLPVAYSPVDNVLSGASWGYALGNWVECNQPTFDESCEARRVFSSPGAFGFYPWIDKSNSYWAVLSVQLFSGGPTARSYDLVRQLRPAIEHALP